MLTDNEILLAAAKRNYHRFKTPTNLVESRKTKRYYTPEQLADLDIKTSVNKIGEIVNLSQILNNLYWDNVAKGQTHEQNHELYCDIAQLDVLSNLAIDSAKREFPVDITAELSKLRKKYEEVLTDEKTGKALQPNFFAHISKLKGYYNPEKKLYAKQESSMDYIQTVMNKYRRKGSGYKLNIEPFVNILDKTKYRKSFVNRKQFNMIINAMETYATMKRKIWSSGDDTSRDEKIRWLDLEKQKCIEAVGQKHIGYSTMYELLSLLDNPDYKHLKSIIIEVLFHLGNADFFSALRKSQEPLEIIYQDPAGSETILGINFKKTTVLRDSLTIDPQN